MASAARTNIAREADMTPGVADAMRRLKIIPLLGLVARGGFITVDSSAKGLIRQCRIEEETCVE
jgi:hypothetical protein